MNNSKKAKISHRCLIFYYSPSIFWTGEQKMNEKNEENMDDIEE